MIGRVARLTLFGCMILPTIASAQAPWTATLTPTMNPLPVGGCAAIHLTLSDPSTRDVPRSPSGWRVLTGHFDFTVATPDGLSAAVQYSGANNVSVCGCQGASEGTVATVTATYPAQALAVKDRVPGVAFEQSTSVTLAAPKGSSNPTECQALASAPITQRTSTVATVQKPAPRAAVPPPVAQPPVPPTRMEAVADARPRTNVPPPTGVTVTGTPLKPRVTWTAAPNATRYSVWRSDDQGNGVERSPAALTATDFSETVPDPRTYRYTVVAHYADGTTGRAQPVTFVSPPLVNPTGFAVTQKTKIGTAAEVEFSWNAVSGATQYRLDGPGFPVAGQHVTGTTVLAPQIPRGAGAWKVTALYPGNFADYASATTTEAVIRVLPQHSAPWLTRNNGPGSQDEVQMPREGKYHCFSFFFCTSESVLPNQLQHPYDANYATWLGATLPTSGAAAPKGIQTWLDINIKLWNVAGQGSDEAVYGNPGDLGVGRRSYCTQTTRTSQLPGIYTVCYASAHGIAPGEPGFNDPAIITNPGDGNSSQLLLTMVITKEPTGSVFMVFKPAPKYTLSPTVTLDTEGAKFVPHACLSCHGGSYNTTTRKVDGASFLPIDPDLQLFKSPAEKANQQFKIRRINEIIAKSGSSAAVVAYINGLYGNAVSVPHQQAKTDYVPPGWQSQAGLYRQVVKPYCAMCHLAATPDLSFASWGNFQSNAVRIKQAVCSAHTMPHSELQFKDFWMKDTGVLYLPGLLAAALGFSKC